MRAPSAFLTTGYTPPPPLTFAKDDYSLKNFYTSDALASSIT